MSQQDTLDDAISDLVVANHILAAEGILDGFGHVSVRDPRDPACYLMSRSLAPALVTARDVIRHDLENRPTQEEDREQKLYYERWIQGEVYKARPDVNAVVHSHSPTVVPFASTKAPLRPLLHNASFLGFGAPVFEIRNFVPNSDLMISTAALGKAMAEALGPRADDPDRGVPRLLHRDQCAPAAAGDGARTQRRRLHGCRRVRDHGQGHAIRGRTALGIVEEQGHGEVALSTRHLAPKKANPCRSCL
jgi:ribulose-5-phosphate 4-epimerase/fuculose-1-phosphate aldolase